MVELIGIALVVVFVYALYIHYKLRNLDKRHSEGLLATKSLIEATDQKYYEKIQTITPEPEVPE